jgi:TonB family protein
MSGHPDLLPFQSLEFERPPWTRWAVSLAIHAGSILVLIAIPVAVQRSLPQPDRLSPITLIAPVKPTPPKTRVLPMPSIKPNLLPKPVEFKAPPPIPLQAKAIVVLSNPAVLSAPAPTPELAATPHFAAPALDFPVKPVKQEVFLANTVATVSPDVPLRAIKTGGFGDPNGAQTAATTAAKGLTVQQTGAFDALLGQESRTGTHRKGQTIASAGFGAVSSAAGGGNGHATVQTAGFGENEAPARRTPVVRSAAPTDTPVEITSKPKPLYTPEAREKKIEGEVLLEVRFTSSGEVRVLRLLRGLGFGLDENARNAASGIHFRPATRNGSPVDVTGTVHIVFETS